MSESGYQQVAALKSDEAMAVFVKQVLSERGMQVSNEGELNGFVRFYSGTEAVQNFAHLKEELFAKPWVEAIPHAAEASFSEQPAPTAKTEAGPFEKRAPPVRNAPPSEPMMFTDSGAPPLNHHPAAATAAAKRSALPSKGARSGSAKKNPSRSSGPHHAPPPRKPFVSGKQASEGVKEGIIARTAAPKTAPLANAGAKSAPQMTAPAAKPQQYPSVHHSTNVQATHSYLPAEHGAPEPQTNSLRPGLPHGGKAAPMQVHKASFLRSTKVAPKRSPKTSAIWGSQSTAKQLVPNKPIAVTQIENSHESARPVPSVHSAPAKNASLFYQDALNSTNWSSVRHARRLAEIKHAGAAVGHTGAGKVAGKAVADEVRTLGPKKVVAPSKASHGAAAARDHRQHATAAPRHDTTKTASPPATRGIATAKQLTAEHGASEVFKEGSVHKESTFRHVNRARHAAQRALVAAVRDAQTPALEKVVAQRFPNPRPEVSVNNANIVTRSSRGLLAATRDAKVAASAAKKAAPELAAHTPVVQRPLVHAPQNVAKKPIHASHKQVLAAHKPVMATEVSALAEKTEAKAMLGARKRVATSTATFIAPNAASAPSLPIQGEHNGQSLSTLPDERPAAYKATSFRAKDKDMLVHAGKKHRSTQISLMGTSSTTRKSTRRLATNVSAAPVLDYEEELPEVTSLTAESRKVLSAIGNDNSNMLKAVFANFTAMRTNLQADRRRHEASLAVMAKANADIKFENLDVSKTISSINAATDVLANESKRMELSCQIQKSAIAVLQQKVLVSLSFLDESLNSTDDADLYMPDEVLAPLRSTTPVPDLDYFLTKARAQYAEPEDSSRPSAKLPETTTTTTYNLVIDELEGTPKLSAADVVSNFLSGSLGDEGTTDASDTGVLSLLQVETQNMPQAQLDVSPESSQEATPTQKLRLQISRAMYTLNDTVSEIQRLVSKEVSEYQTSYDQAHFKLERRHGKLEDESQRLSLELEESRQTKRAMGRAERHLESVSAELELRLQGFDAMLGDIAGDLESAMARADGVKL